MSPGSLCPAPLALVCNFPQSAAAPAEVPDDCIISQGVHTPFLPSPLPAGRGDPQACTGRIGLCAKPGSTGLSHLTFPSSHISLSLQFVHTRYSAPLWKEERPGPIWQHPLSTIKTVISFDLIIPLLGIASREIIQKKKKKDTCPIIATLFTIRRKWKQMPQPKIEND